MPLNRDIDSALDPLLAGFDDKLQADIAGQIAETHVSGTAEMVTWGKTKADVPIAYEGPPIQGAIDWAGKHSATLVKGIDEETKKRLAHTISQGIEQKRGIPGLARDIRNTFSDMSKHRSELIARTETANALSTASLESMSDMGIDGKEWITAGDDLVSDECSGNEAEGVIPVNQEFSGGVMAPPQHPDCRCTISPARLPTIKDEPPVTRPAPAKSKTDSPEMQKLFKDKLKAGKGKFDEEGLKATMKELRSVGLPDSHLATVNRIDVNTALLKRRAPGSMASCDGANNIVLASKVAQENITHEIGHAFWKKRVFIPRDNTKYKILDIFKASEKTGKGFVSSYAKMNVDEFFAESYAAFAKNPTAFTKLNPPMAKILKAYWK